MGQEAGVRKGKRAKITKRGERLIIEWATRRREIPPPALAVELQEALKKMGQDVPVNEVLEKKISKYRNHPESPLDEPWSVGCLAEYEIPPEALPVVMHIYENRLREEEQYFTIREVMWIARLYKLIDNTIALEDFAYAYAEREKIDWILGNTPNTRGGFDFSLINLINYNSPNEWAQLIDFGRINYLPAWGDAEEEELKKKLKKRGFKLERGR